MPMYIFYPCRDDGLPTSFEAFEIGDDEAARAQAEKVLESHSSATQVMIWCDGEALEPVRRDPPDRSDEPEAPSPGS